MGNLDNQDKARQGAIRVLRDCLVLTDGEHLSIFYDDTTETAARILIDEARNLRLTVTECFVPLSEQCERSKANSIQLTIEELEALHEARGILTCLAGGIASASYRIKLVSEGTDANKRLGHMPGVNIETLSKALNIDYGEAIRRCDDLALAMTLGNRATVTSYAVDRAGNVVDEAKMTLDLGGLNRSPITSTGRIPIGTWGNLPGGETFIAPMEQKSSGEFILSGAFTDYVMKKTEFVRLHFANGRLQQSEGNDPSFKKFEDLINTAKNNDPDNYNVVAELGIGVNSGITELTGSCLFDEKCSGTAHIAIGDSTRYGGNNPSKIHEDLVTRNPSIDIDGCSILNKGENSFNPNHWRERFEGVKPLDNLSSVSLLSRSEIGAKATPDGSLVVQREVAAGRICNYTVGFQETSRILADVYRKIPPNGNAINVENFIDNTDWNKDLILRSLTILLNHGLIWISNKE